ncbi:hypothetical protein LPB85_04155 [Chryseobacterium sp. LC2016-27]|uniref:hypothetical protein n=1 Tax=Chryseobacterium sp. LC2016-27 TaxID=2897326 RepID=UPI001E39CB05|nr:hypothetical protein [Chryseobacterium sp. LC2016-27]MCD0454637.1 hypothetical protein [Chryseobacterium sp. LC2016-27]
MKKIFVLFSVIFSHLLFSQISDKIRDKVEIIDEKYFKIILSDSYPINEYAELSKLYGELSKNVTSDELYYLSLMGNDFIKRNAVFDLLLKKDSRIVKLYKHYSQFPVKYRDKIGHVVTDQDMALSNIRGYIVSRITQYQNFIFFKGKLKNELSDHYSEEEINYYNNLDIKHYQNLISEFDKIDKLFIPDRLEICNEIGKFWKDEKLKMPTP